MGKRCGAVRIGPKVGLLSDFFYQLSFTYFHLCFPLLSSLLLNLSLTNFSFLLLFCAFLFLIFPKSDCQSPATAEWKVGSPGAMPAQSTYMRVPSGRECVRLPAAQGGWGHTYARRRAAARPGGAEGQSAAAPLGHGARHSWQACFRRPI